MAIIYTYPSATPKASDKLIGTVTEDVNAVNVVKGNPTRSFTLSAVQSLFNQDVVNVVVPITATVFKTLTSSNYLTILAAPGAGKALDIQQIILFVDAGTTPFNATSDPYIEGPYSVNNGGIPRATVINAAASTNVLYKYLLWNETAGSYIIAQNTALEFKTAQVAKTTAGNGIIYISVTYKIVNTTASMV